MNEPKLCVMYYQMVP